MANITIALAAALMVLGVGGYIGSGSVSPTALIPAAFGLLLLVFGVVARDPAKRKHAMHGAAMVGLLGVLGTASGLFKFFQMATGTPVARPQAVITQAAMCVLCLVFVGLCVKSFIDARRSGAI
ncbi:MAG: hypothetical protein SGI92_09665 [Bryobacteraceae bacterium]|nr:hypothetical protein [Bryobacteraceae bacterium]